ncbi:MAG TPA: IS21 family transposase [Anaerolineae bacterium]|nr:IS21 family transposase [Anaerolineae bacterium]
MLTVETIRKVRLAYHRDAKSIRQIAKELHMSRNTVKRVLRTDVTEFQYTRKSQPKPKLEGFIESLVAKLKEDDGFPKKRRRTAQGLFEQIQAEGYLGAYDSVRRFVRQWRDDQHHLGRQVFIPLSFAPPEAFQFDWSHEQVELAGMPAIVKVAHIRLCYSRFPLCIAYPRETQEMVFDAHARAFEFFGGATKRGIYDNMKTAVLKILQGKERDFSKRFEQMCSHYLFEPVACTPSAGWEKGQVENQVGMSRNRFFTPLQKFATIADLNESLLSRCIAWAKTHNHPAIAGKTIWQAFEEERPYLVGLPRPFDGYCEHISRVSSTCLVCFDRNRYSVMCTEAGRLVQVRAYADRIKIIRDGRVVAEHVRHFGRDKTIFNPWHYLPVLQRKPGALRNGAPFKDWELPETLKKTLASLERFSDWDRQFVAILSAVPMHGMGAVEEACAGALGSGAVSSDVVLNLLSRARDEDVPKTIEPPLHLRLKQEPIADCNRYDSLLREVRYAAQ